MRCFDLFLAVLGLVLLVPLFIGAVLVSLMFQPGSPLYLHKTNWVDKLCGDSRVDIEHTKRALGWKPKVTMEGELERTAKWWRSR